MFDCSASVVTIFSQAGGTLYSAYGLSGSGGSSELLGPPRLQPDIARGAGCCSWVLLQLHRKMLVIDDCSTDMRYNIPFSCL